MYKPRYQIKMLINMVREFVRLVKLFTVPQSRGWRWHLLGEWQMNDYKPNRTFSRPYRLAEYIDPRDGYSSVMRDDEGREVRIPRDLYDQIMDTIGNIVNLFWTNIFIENTCTHPHSKVWIEWEGDRTYGYYSQHSCQKCRGYVGGVAEVDRYLPPEERHPEKIRGNPVNPMCRGSVQDRMNEEINRLVMQDDDGEY